MFHITGKYGALKVLDLYLSIRHLQEHDTKNGLLKYKCTLTVQFLDLHSLFLFLFYFEQTMRNGYGITQ